MNKEIQVRAYSTNSVFVTSGAVYDPPRFSTISFGIEVFSDALERPVKSPSKSAVQSRELIATFEGSWFNSTESRCASSNLHDALKSLENHSRVDYKHTGIYVIEHSNIDLRPCYVEDMSLFIKHLVGVVSNLCIRNLGTKVTGVIWSLKQEELAYVNQFKERDFRLFEQDTGTYFRVVNTSTEAYLICEKVRV